MHQWQGRIPTPIVSLQVPLWMTSGLLTLLVSAGVADAATLSQWRFNPDAAQLELILTSGVTPRYFVLAQPARIVLDLPSIDVLAVSGVQTFGGAVRSVRVAQFEPDLGRIVLELNPDVELAPGQVELTAVETLASGETRWVLRPLLQGDDPANNTLARAPEPAPAPAPTPAPTPAPAVAPTPAPATVPPDQGAAWLQTDPVSSPMAAADTPEGAPPAREPSGEPSVDQSDAFYFPDTQGVEIPVQFPAPTPSDGGIAAADPASRPAAPQISVPPPVEPAPQTAVRPLPDAMPMPPIASPTTPISVGDTPSASEAGLAMGQGVRLRYPRTTPLQVPAVQPWQEVLVVVDAVRDRTGAVLIPAGSQVIGRFEASGGGMRFVTQAIAIQEQVFLLEAVSSPLSQEAGILLRPSQEITVQLLQAWQPAL